MLRPREAPGAEQSWLRNPALDLPLLALLGDGGGRHDGIELARLGYGIAVDAAGSAYVVGVTNSDETTFPVKVGPDLTSNDRYDAFVAKLEGIPCTPDPARMGGFRATKSVSNRDDIDFSWPVDSASLGYNIWYVAAKEDIAFAQLLNPLIAKPVPGCAVPTPALGTTCTDFGAILRPGPKNLIYYRIHGFCDPLTEGP